MIKEHFPHHEDYKRTFYLIECLQHHSWRCNGDVCVCVCAQYVCPYYT